jgi:hypothetical protein
MAAHMQTHLSCTVTADGVAPRSGTLRATCSAVRTPLPICAKAMTGR